MLSLIEVKCPHCGTEGQINLPPLGAIIVGPCPECQEMVVIYCGRVMPLDKEIMKHGSSAERRDHLKAILRQYVENRVDKLFDSMEKNAEIGYADSVENMTPAEKGEHVRHALTEHGNISDEDVEKFKTLELRLIDDVEYFRSVFE